MEFNNEKEKREFNDRALLVVRRLAYKIHREIPNYSFGELVLEGLSHVWSRVLQFDPTIAEWEEFVYYASSIRFASIKRMEMKTGRFRG